MGLLSGQEYPPPLTTQLFADLTTVVASKDAEAVAKLHERYQAEADRYKDEQKETGHQGPRT